MIDIGTELEAVFSEPQYRADEWQSAWGVVRGPARKRMLGHLARQAAKGGLSPTHVGRLVQGVNASQCEPPLSATAVAKITSDLPTASSQRELTECLLRIIRRSVVGCCADLFSDAERKVVLGLVRLGLQHRNVERGRLNGRVVVEATASLLSEVAHVSRGQVQTALRKLGGLGLVVRLRTGIPGVSSIYEIPTDTWGETLAAIAESGRMSLHVGPVAHINHLAFGYRSGANQVLFFALHGSLPATRLQLLHRTGLSAPTFRKAMRVALQYRLARKVAGGYVRSGDTFELDDIASHTGQTRIATARLARRQDELARRGKKPAPTTKGVRASSSSKSMSALGQDFSVSTDRQVTR